MKAKLFICTLAVCLSHSANAQAQQTPSLSPKAIDPSPTQVPNLPDTIPSTQKVPQLKPRTLSVPSNSTPAVEAKVRVGRVEILGSKAFSPKELSAVTAPFTNKSLTFNQLLGIRAAITNLYTSRGYTTSGAFLPPQDVTDGVVQVQVIEGQLERIEIRGLSRLRNGYVRSRIARAVQTPINISRLESALQLLQLNPLFSKVSAELTAGTSPSRSVLVLNLQESKRFRSALSVNNQESPSVGSTGTNATLAYNNLLGLGDRLSTTTNLTEGVFSFGVSYEIPITTRDGRISLRYDNGRNRVIEQPFAPLDIKGKSETYSIGFGQPLTQTPSTEFALGLSADLRRSRTFIFDNEPFSFTTGPEEGESKVTVLRFTQDWTKRRPNQVLAARSQFSLGLGLLGATVNNTGTDGRFFSWLGQFQWVNALNEQKDATLIIRTAAQLTGDSLLPLEQFSIGGLESVRGYRANQRVGDSGIIGSVELRLPIVRDSGGFGLLQITPFIDVGTIWNSREKEGETGILASTGLGLRWQLRNSLAARLSWGIPLLKVDSQGDSLQDDGIDFALEWQPF